MSTGILNCRVREELESRHDLLPDSIEVGKTYIFLLHKKISLHAVLDKAIYGSLAVCLLIKKQPLNSWEF